MIQLRLLGTLTLVDADGREVDGLLGQSRRMALLAYLAVARPAGLHRRDRLLAMFWPEQDEERGRTALRQALHVLRGALGTDAIVSRGTEDVGLNSAVVHTDVAQFEQAIASDDAGHALELYRGPLLDAFHISNAPAFDEWVEAERGRLAELAVKAARTLVDRAEMAGDIAAAVQWARRATTLMPSDENMLRRLMALLDRHGERASALRAYDAFAQRLSAEYDATPAPETQLLIARIRARETSTQRPESRDVSVAPGPVNTSENAPLPAGRRRPRWRIALVSVAVTIAAIAVLALRVGDRRAQAELTQASSSMKSAAPSLRSEAYELYIRARTHTIRENRVDDSLAIGLLERAVAIEPGFAAAQAELAHAYGVRVFHFVPSETATLEKAQVAAATALRIAPQLAEAHEAQSFLIWWRPGPNPGGPGQFNPERAIAESKRAIALDPAFDRAHHTLGMLYLHIGLHDQAVTELRRVLDITPNEDNALRRIAEVRALQGRYQEAVALFRRVDPEANPHLWTAQIGSAFLHLGMDDSAAAVVSAYFARHGADRNGIVSSLRAILYARQGDAVRAEEEIRVAEARGKAFIHFHHAAYNIAVAYAILHRPADAVRWLRTVADGGMPCFPLFARDVFLDPIRADPAFVAFLAEQRRQWEHFGATLGG